MQILRSSIDSIHIILQQRDLLVLLRALLLNLSQLEVGILQLHLAVAELVFKLLDDCCAVSRELLEVCQLLGLLAQLLGRVFCTPFVQVEDAFLLSELGQLLSCLSVGLIQLLDSSLDFCDREFDRFVGLHFFCFVKGCDLVRDPFELASE